MLRTVRVPHGPEKIATEDIDQYNPGTRSTPPWRLFLSVFASTTTETGTRTQPQTLTTVVACCDSRANNFNTRAIVQVNPAEKNCVQDESLRISQEVIKNTRDLRTKYRSLTRTN